MYQNHKNNQLGSSERISDLMEQLKTEFSKTESELSITKQHKEEYEKKSK